MYISISLYPPWYLLSRPRAWAGLYNISPLLILYGVWQTQGGSGGGSYIAHSMCNSIAIVWAMQVEGAIEGWSTTARTLWSERISCKGWRVCVCCERHLSRAVCVSSGDGLTLTLPLHGYLRSSRVSIYLEMFIYINHVSVYSFTCMHACVHILTCSGCLGVARRGRSAGCVLCALWAVSAAVLGGGTLWG